MKQFGLIALILALALPAAAIAQDDWDDGWGDDAAPTVEVHGFVEGATAARVSNDHPASPDDFVLGEARFRLDLAHFTDRAEFRFKGDFVADDVTGESDIDIRQAIMVLRAASWLDMRVGRQVLTWGTGDFVFLNDMFPKDFQSFFIGRDDEFLKAPSNSIKFSAYWDFANVDFVWTPVFEPDVFITGERLSFFSPMAGEIVSSSSMGQPLQAITPARQLEDGEFALRVYKNVSGYELAAYGYKGFSKQPLAFDTDAMMPAFAELAVYGTSVRGNLLGGVANVEGAYHHSLDDEDGDDPNLPNSQLRTLVGYEREVVANFTAGVQHYLEYVQNHDELIENSPAPGFEPIEARHTGTLRLTYRAMQQTLTFSLFTFFAFEDEDVHLRPSITRKWTDAVTVVLGGNVMAGDDPTFFGQLEDNTNAYLRFRYSF